MTSEATRKAISSPASADGPTPSDSPDGPTTDLFGQALSLPAVQRRRQRARRPMTNATCGLLGFLSSPSAALQPSLESRLKRRLDGAGSTLFSLTWKAKATPAGRPYCQLAASARRTSDSDCGSWPTPMAGNASAEGLQRGGEQRQRPQDGRALRLAPTPAIEGWADFTERQGGETCSRRGDAGELADAERMETRLDSRSREAKGRQSLSG